LEKGAAKVSFFPVAKTSVSFKLYDHFIHDLVTLKSGVLYH